MGRADTPYHGRLLAYLYLPRVLVAATTGLLSGSVLLTYREWSGQAHLVDFVSSAANLLYPWAVIGAAVSLLVSSVRAAPVQLGPLLPVVFAVMLAQLA
jgi:hypothetical protein